MFLLSQNVSLFGSSVVAFSMIWYVTLRTSSGKWAMLSTICSLLPQVVVSLWAGVWADRYDRKRIIMFADGFIALSTLALAGAFFAGYESLELLMVVAAVRSVGAGIQTPAVSAVLPQIVPPDQLVKVNGINQSLNALLFLLSPAVGGVLLGQLGISWCFLLDVITAAAAIAILRFIEIEKLENTRGNVTVFEDLKQGWAFTFNDRLLKRLVVCYGVSFFLITPAAFFTPVMIERTFGNEVWRLTANEIVWTVGTLIGGFYVSLKGRFKNKVAAIAVSLAGFGVTFALLGVASHFYFYLLVMGIAGFFLPIFTTAETVLIQENVSPSMMGRVFSILQLVSGSSMPIAMLFFGPLADAVRIEGILLVTGTLLACVGAAMMRYATENPS